MKSQPVTAELDKRGSVLRMISYFIIIGTLWRGARTHISITSEGQATQSLVLALELKYIRWLKGLTVARQRLPACTAQCLVKVAAVF